MVSDRAKQAMEDERREYYRIEDEVSLDYRVICAPESDTVIERIHSRIPDRFTASSSFAATSRQIAQAMHKLQTDAPELARCLEILDGKLNTLARLLVTEEMDLQQHPVQTVNLSAGGLLFRAREALPVDTLLELRMVLLPALTGILSVSRVVNCEQINDGNLKYPWQLAVEYQHLRESDRELLVRHVMNKQTSHLRARREAGD